MKNKPSAYTPVIININACDGCGQCADICPTGALAMKVITAEEKKELSFLGRLKVRIKGDVKSYVAEPDKCIACGRCAKSCHEHAITVSRMKKTA